jgi:hypothetical protein
MRHLSLAAALIVALTPVRVFAQSVALTGTLNVPSARDFASEAFQDPWDMNQRTDFGWFLHGVDNPPSGMSNVSFSGGIFSANTGASANVFLLEPGNPNAARLGKVGSNHPINAGVFRLLALRMNVAGGSQSSVVWHSDTIWNSSPNIGAFNHSQGWRTYLIDLQTLALNPGSSAWANTVRTLQIYFSGSSVQIDWARLVNVDASLCRRVTWSGFPANVDIYLDTDASPGGEWLLAPNVASNTASAGCSAAGQGYNFYAGGLAPGNYHLAVRPAGGGTLTRSPSFYLVNAIPTLTITSPSDEGSADDFATTVLGNPWDMNATSDVAQFFNISNPAITTINAETPGGTPLPGTRVLWGTSTQAQPNRAGDPNFATLWFSPTVRIDPARYRILTAEFGVPNMPRSVNTGSIARIVWRVAGDPQGMGVSDDIIFNHRAGANVLDKFSVDMADRSVLRIEQGSTMGWVPGNSANPGLDIFRFDVHEFSSPTPFYVTRLKLAALERVAPGGSYTIRWTVSEPSGTVTLYRDTDKDPSSGRVMIGSKGAAGTTDAFVWNSNIPSSGQYFIYVEFNDGQGNVNGAYARWPIVIGAPLGGFLTTPGNLRVIR